MNILKGEIEAIKINQSLSLVTIKAGENFLTAIVIDTPQTAPYLRTRNSVNVIFKETEVIIGTGRNLPVSLQNQLPGIIQSVESGDLLSKIIVETTSGKVVSVITTNAVRQLGLEEGSSVVAMIKTNEIMLSA